MDRRAVERLQSVNDFDSLLTYLRDELDWPVEDYGFDDLTFQYTAQELGLDDQSAAKVTAIRRLRPLDDEQPWGIFFLELEPKRLPVVALRRLLSKMTLKKRASSNRSESPAWHADDILFISRTGESDERHLTFAHFAANPEKADLPVLKVLGWDASDTVLRIDHVAEVLKEKLVWPEDPSDSDQWRKQWRDAFALKYRQQVTTAKEMASRLAELARGIRGAIREVLAVESESGPLTKIMGAFRESLVHDLDPEQFADTYAQTITYGLLSARITDPTKNRLDDLASHMQTNPFLKELMESFIHVGGREKNDSGVGLDFDELGVSHVIELLDNANMEAVVRDFGKHNQQEDPVIHFFEGFLQEYDKSIRKDRGVFYTPRPVVSFIVRSVDELLRTKFGLEDGLADTTTWGEMAGRIDDLEIPEGATPDKVFVQILDPATGTGTFLVEVIDLIHKTMIAKWQSEGHGKKKIEDRWNDYVPKHLLPRLHGYELMMAPYAIAHMKIGLKLYETGYHFESHERARVYLTNALEPAQDFSGTLAFAIPALAHEAEAVNAIKRDQRFTVVIGNPPYSLYSANLDEAKRALIDRYRYVNGERIRQRGALQLEKNLQDDYVKFFAVCEKEVLHSQLGILALVTNHGYLNNLSLAGLRSSLLNTFTTIKLIDLLGSVSRRDKRLGKDENVFDISQGVAVGIFQREHGIKISQVELGELRGARKEKYLKLDTSNISEMQLQHISPSSPHYIFDSFNQEAGDEYKNYLAIDEFFTEYSSGMVTARDAITVHFDRNDLSNVVDIFLNSNGDTVRKTLKLGKDTKDWSVKNAREDLSAEKNPEDKYQKVEYRPFDTRWTFYSGRARGFLCNPRKPVFTHMLSQDNLALIVNKQVNTEFKHVFITRHLIDTCTLSSATRETAYIFPLWCGNVDGELLYDDARIPNMRVSKLREFFSECLQERESGVDEPRLSLPVLGYIYALLSSQLYRERYEKELRFGFPRIPKPPSFDFFEEISHLGRQLMKSHFLEDLPPSGISVLDVQGRVVEKCEFSDGTVWIDKAKTRGFRGVPEEVWNFHIGGYQVCEKWLKDRQAKGGKNPRPGRVLTDEDIEHYQKIVVALSETIRIMAEIDEVIEAHGGWPGAFQTGDAEDKPASDVVYAEADDDTTQLDMVAEPKDG